MVDYDEIKALEAAFSKRLPEEFLCTVELDEEIGNISVRIRRMRGGKIESFTYYISPITLQYLSIDQIVNSGFDFEHPLLDWIRKVEEEPNDVINEKNIPEIAESFGMSILDLRMAYFGALIRRSKTITIQDQTFKVEGS